ncbi:eukaryotic translation initiation factor 2-alpha kinase [Coccinella septempunctata]|uniref:eukaryotic translation initiation factor 2-alpha kinase n=1 Tax=Coccinella septempunctata TaxID=41139 RepID=UPI001D0924BE|nr:eukaryotic translation initiation factor 2-alpha kinase [Coccinella septempunctata]
MYSIAGIFRLNLSIISFIYLFVCGYCELEEISYCSEPQSSAILVSTLDGQFTKLTDHGDVKWSIKTGPETLLNSNIHNLELTNNGQWVRIIPSLKGMLYKFDGHTVDPISVTAESLLKSSFKYSDDLVMAGSIEVKTYGIGFRSGQVFYECSPLRCKNITENADAEDDMLVLKRTTQTVRAIELRTGNEKWNFSVGDVNVNLPRISCIDVNARKIKWNITAVLPDGLLEVDHVLNDAHVSWQYQFSSPIVKVWKWSGTTLEEIDMFTQKTETFLSPINAAIYIGMHNKQLYIHESRRMQNMLERKSHQDVAVVESKSLSKIPWKPIPASSMIEEDDSTALAVLYGSTYVNGNGYFLYTETDLEKKNTELCEKNDTVEEIEIGTVEYIIAPIWVWWKEIAVISLTTAIAFHMVFRIGLSRQLSRKSSSTNTSLEIPRSEDKLTERRISESSSNLSSFSSRYLNDFDTLQCLGKGGFGVVFQVKQKIDECQYALKRIRLPNEKAKRERVMREVKALAKLEHQHIVRYFNSWVEHPPAGWQQTHDNNWLSDSEATSNMMTSSHRRTQSVSIAIESDEEESPNRLSDSSDDFIVFENSNGLDVTQKSESTLPSSINTETPKSHSLKKINWKRPSRKSYSLDLTKKFSLDPPIFLYIQMQLCQKENLKDWLLINPKRDKMVVLDIFGQILSAVEYVHLQGLIHRDLKPGNIFFSLEGQIKVGDFGLVKDIESCRDLESTSLLSPGSYGHTKEVGTRLYMSPEQIYNKKYDYKVDIYSLGLIFFELLTPFGTDMERFKALSSLRDDEYPRNFPVTHKDEYSLLKSMLCEDPKKRLTTIGIRALLFSDADSVSQDKKFFYELPKVIK